LFGFITSPLPLKSCSAIPLCGRAADKAMPERR